MSSLMGRLWLVRHGETAYARDGRHTGWADIGLTEKGREQAAALRPFLEKYAFARVVVSPLRRARETCELAGFNGRAEVVPELKEWNYGSYEGRTRAEVLDERPEWDHWRDGFPGGETLDDVAGRARKALSTLDSAGPVLVFAHGHLLRILTALHLGLPALEARRFMMRPASVSILGEENRHPAIRLWNWEVQ